MSSKPSHGAPLPDGTTNANPEGIGLLGLIAEDFRTHDRKLSEPGFWACTVHRLGNARMAVKPPLLRAPLSVIYRAGFVMTNIVFGIELPYTTPLGRRVRFWHHGGIVISARSIGNDVHIRHNTTLGIARRNDLEARPIIGDRADIGVGACILGAVTVGQDAKVGANSVVVDDVPDGATAVGAPARIVLKGNVMRSQSGTRFRAVSVSSAGPAPTRWSNRENK